MNPNWSLAHQKVLHHYTAPCAFRGKYCSGEEVASWRVWNWKAPAGSNRQLPVGSRKPLPYRNACPRLPGFHWRSSAFWIFLNLWNLQTKPHSYVWGPNVDCGPLICNPSFKIIKDLWSLDSDEGACTELTFGFINNQPHQYILHLNRGIISL